MHSYNKNYQYLYVDTQDQLEALCANYAKLSVIAIDTEFVRTETLRPLLGLIQVFDKQQVALIDPVAVQDLSVFASILSNTNIVKVAHSCSEDLEALWHHLGVIPAPVFDTQFAAGVLDLGVSIGYANLIEQLYSIQIDKGESRTDWLRRPLSSAQCEYASADVTHLMAIYEDLNKQIYDSGKTQWVYDEIAVLGKKKSTPIAAEYAYFNYKNNWKLSRKQLYALKLLAKWRLEEARNLNKSVNFVVKEVAIFEIALKLPMNNQALFECHQLYSKQARMYGDKLIEICTEVNAASTSLYPPKIQRLIEFSSYKQCLTKLKELIENMAAELKVPISILASKKQMNQLLKWYWFDFDELIGQNLLPDLLVGWRGELLKPKLSNTAEFGKLIVSYHEIKRSI